MPKAHASVDECLLLVKLKREHAVAAMRKIVIEFGLPRHIFPKVTTILDYLTNMAYCIEMMLELLSNDWETHNVGEMYETVFGAPHANQTLMDELKIALVAQKYLFEPNGGLLAHISDLEKLHDELREKIREKHTKFAVQRDIPAPPPFLSYLQANVPRFYNGGVTVNLPENIPADYDLSEFTDHVAEGMRREVREIEDFIDDHIQKGKALIFHMGRFSVI